MVDRVVIVPHPDDERRWRNWQARGAEGDRRGAKMMRGVMLLIVAALLVWAFVELA